MRKLEREREREVINEQSIHDVRMGSHIDRWCWQVARNSPRHVGERVRSWSGGVCYVIMDELMFDLDRAIWLGRAQLLDIEGVCGGLQARCLVGLIVKPTLNWGWPSLEQLPPSWSPLKGVRLWFEFSYPLNFRACLVYVWIVSCCRELDIWSVVLALGPRMHVDRSVEDIVEMWWGSDTLFHFVWKHRFITNFLFERLLVEETCLVDLAHWALSSTPT